MSKLDILNDLLLIACKEGITAVTKNDTHAKRKADSVIEFLQRQIDKI